MMIIIIINILINDHCCKSSSNYDAADEKLLHSVSALGLLCTRIRTRKRKETST